MFVACPIFQEDFRVPQVVLLKKRPRMVFEVLAVVNINTVEVATEKTGIIGAIVLKSYR